VLDFARVFPPQAILNKSSMYVQILDVILKLTLRAKKPNAIFYELLRPELLVHYKAHLQRVQPDVPFQGLSSDAFSGVYSCYLIYFYFIFVSLFLFNIYLFI
jgi:hypothetical protein